MSDDLKPTNPKDAQAVARLPLHLVVFAALAFVEGDAKYGGYNWRVAGVRASVYRSSVDRHFKKWWNGEWADPKTGVPHLASALAGIGIILDAYVAGKLTDDRPPPVPLSGLIDDAEADVRAIMDLFADRKPKRWTIEDVTLGK